MSLQLGAVKQLVLSIRQKICGVIRNVRECVRREAFPHTHYTVVHVERKSLQSEKPRSKSTQCAKGNLVRRVDKLDNFFGSFKHTDDIL